MKKGLAIIFILALILSITACSKENKDTALTTTETQAVTTLIPTEESTGSPTVPSTTQSNPTTYITVEEWIANNKDMVDTYCKTANETITSAYEGDDPNFNFGLKIEAQGNALFVTSTISCRDEETNEDFMEMFEYTNQRIITMSAEEQQEALAIIPEQYGFIGMPVPESCTSIVLDKDGNTMLEFTYPCETYTPTHDSVKEWIDDNKDLVEEICQESSYTEGSYNVRISLSAEGNTLYYIATLSGELTEDDINFEVESVKEEQAYWDSLSDKEKTERIKNMAFSFHYTMPVPDKIITLIFKEDGTKIAEMVLSLSNQQV